jgi:agmatine deiminase
VARALGDDVREADIVLEGGSILPCGDGILLTTEQCLLHPSRNPSLSREEIEAALVRWLGVERVAWLGRGLLEDRDTDGHVDLIAASCGPRRVLLQTVEERNPNFAHCQENVARAQAAGLSVVPFPYLPYVTVAGELLAASYLNLYVCNGAVIVPVCGDDSEPDALSLIAEAFPGREVVPVPGAVIAFGGGGPHCITQQVPTRLPPEP